MKSGGSDSGDGVLWSRPISRPVPDADDAAPSAAASGIVVEAAVRAEPRVRAGAKQRAPSGDPLVDSIIEHAQVEIVFQRVIELISGQIVGFEALARGPIGPLRSPAALFAAARAVGVAGELDWVCRAAAFRAFLDARLPADLSLFVNVERDSLVTPCPPHLLDVIREAERTLRVFVDIGGRAVARYPKEVLATVRRARASSWGVALNDLELGAAVLGMIPLIEPDVIRLNAKTRAIGLHHGRMALFAALAEAEQTGAAVLMEQVETKDGETLAIASGARFAQGHHYGRPGPLPSAVALPSRPLKLLERVVDDATPFAIASASGPSSRMSVDATAVRALIGDFVALVDVATHPMCVGVLAADSSVVPADVASAFAQVLADRSVLDLVLGRDVAVYRDWSTTTAALPPGHPFLREICYVAVSPQSSLMVAFKLAAGTSRWNAIVSQNGAVCRSVLRRLLAEVDQARRGALTS